MALLSINRKNFTYARPSSRCTRHQMTMVVVAVATFLVTPLISADDSLEWPEVTTLNQKADGYRGIWYMNQKTGDEYQYKYSGGLGTYCDYHAPFAVYRPEVDKTFFCYGGSSAENSRQLLHMVSYYDHKTGTVPRPTLLLDKKTSDAHDNPVISVDDEGYIWIFSTAHGTGRPAFIHKSKKPYDIEEFEFVPATRQDGDEVVPMDNFSYLQVYHNPEVGFQATFTRYGYPAARTNCYMTSADGVEWSEWKRLAAIEKGHYQIGAVGHGKVGTFFNMHPDPKGLNWRTNLYYMESHDNGETWQTVDGEELEVPLTESENPALVRDYQSEELLIYIKDIQFDSEGNPVLVYSTSGGYEPGPENGPRTLCLAHWTGNEWKFHDVTSNDNNYDSASIYLEDDGTWRIIGATEVGPQPYGTGGEMALWTSKDKGSTWNMEKQLTANSPRNHSYARRPVNYHPDFFALWADGNAREPSESQIYFCDSKGNVYLLPSVMTSDHQKPERLELQDAAQ